mgnify:CR=1 FL=1
MQPDIAGGGYFYDLAPHQIDLLQEIFGCILEASGYKSNRGGLYPAEDTLSACFQFDSGLVGSGSWCFVAHESAREDRIEIIGDKGMICFSVFTYDPIALHTERGREEIIVENPTYVQQPLIQAVVDHLLGAVKMWVETFDIDGLRLDAADCIDKEFFKQLKVYTQGLKKDFWLMGEIIHGDYKMWANPDMMHSVTNYECWKGIYSSHNDKNYFEIAHSLRRQFAKGGIYENLRLYNFLDNHDVNRIASLLKNPADLENVYTMLFCMPGIPSVYYGSEWGIAGVKTSGKEADLPVRPPVEEAEAAKRDTGLEKHIAALSKLRQTTNALVYGEYADILVRNEQLVFVRQYNKEAVIAAFNIAVQRCHWILSGRVKNMRLSLHRTAAV